MTCIRCKHDTAYKFGCYGKRKIQRYRCRSCKATFADAPARTLGNHYTDIDRASKALAMMLEGMSIRAISRLTGLDKNTLLSLLMDAGEHCQKLFERLVRNVRPWHVQADEIWSYIGCHQGRLGSDSPAEWGDAYTWFALDSDTKLVLSYYVGDRNTISAFVFMRDLSSRTLGRFQLTTDALRSYVGAVEEFYGADIDFAQITKVFSKSGAGGPEWYSAAGRVVAVLPNVRTGNPDYRHISTSHIERSNLSLRMHLRRFTRLTNAYSKKLANHKAAIALYMAWYNFCRVHSMIRVTPAMEAGLTDHVWSLAELLS